MSDHSFTLLPGGGAKLIMEFQVTEDHLKLLERMYTSWDNCEYGAPQINPKRPYGNSCVEKDIALTLGWIRDRTSDKMSGVLRDKARAIHEQMQVVLQILLVHCRTGISPGRYKMKENYVSTSWTRMEEEI